MKDSPFMNTAEVAVFLRFVDITTGEPDREAARCFLDKRKVTHFRRGRIVLYRRVDVENTLELVK